MSVTADQLRQLMALGLTGETLTAVVAIFDRHDSVTTRHDASRSKEAVRAARYRANRKENRGNQAQSGVAMAAGTSVTPVTTRHDERDGATSLSIQTVEPKRVVQGSKKEVVVRARGARLPDDWQPSDGDMAYAAARGLRLVEIEIEATKFRNYWTNRTDRQAAKPRWDRAWQNWILNVRKPNADKSVVAAADRLNAKLAEFAAPDLLSGVRGEPGPSDVRLLPPGRGG